MAHVYLCRHRLTAAAKKGWYDEVANMFSTDTGEKGTTKLFLVKVAVPNRVKGDRARAFPPPPLMPR